MILQPTTVRRLWKALMDNATSLITDAHLLLGHGSFGRARSLAVLAQEELGKALWLYETFSQAWSDGDDTPLTVDRLTAAGRKHAVKYMEAFVFGQELSAFWGDYETLYEDAPLDGSQEAWTAWFEVQRAKAAAAGKQANEDKMRGFYVDLQPKGDLLPTPGDSDSGTIADDLQTAAQVVEMLLIKDHSRMKLEASTPYDSTHAQQHRLLSVSHPDEWQSASEEFRRGDYMREDQGSHDAGLPDHSRRSEGRPIEEERKQ